MPAGLPTLCTICVRLGHGSTETWRMPYCSAFPDGIPEKIWLDGYDHRLPYPGDGGLQFELDTEDPGAHLALAAYEEAFPF